MRTLFIFLLIALFLPDVSAQGCFCDAAKHSKGNVHFGLIVRAGLAGFGDVSVNPARVAFSPGIRIGTHLNERITFQTGADIMRFSRLDTRTTYNKNDQQIIDVPLHFLLRFTPDRGRIMPYFSAGLSLRFLTKSHYYQEGTGTLLSYNSPPEMSVNADAGAGIWILISDGFSLRIGVDHRQSLLPLVSESIQPENQLRFSSVHFGFQFHF